MTRSRAYALIVLSTLAWAGVFHLGAYAVRTMTPLAVGAWRFLIAAALVVPIVAWRDPIGAGRLRRAAGLLVAMAFTGVFLFNVTMFTGLRASSALNAALIIALSPALTTVLGAVLHHQSVAARQWFGVALGVSGVACVVSHGQWRALLTLHWGAGDWLLLIASLAWSFYAVLPGVIAHGLSALQLAAGSIVLGALMLLALALSVDPGAMRIPGVGVAGALLFMGAVGTVLAFAWWMQAIVTVGAARATLFLNLTPINTALIGIVLGRRPTWSDALGAALVVLGVTIAVARRTTRQDF